ncbi:hypothetical protein H257_08496 [Aphanomyces astaci]|uniref:Uncharacterized protein n=1 Tax=Aphanomyces astaci TaxID=112090 RepID=W4GE99_APHAT|nr:hypothetical protein H257_08496 [Aphanomyces astaci]ETV77571.1 hypothetical protein H257_08496 [Aphanomyces astaci]|eukprot:XP_009832681.1 hypothetical protein H257_08496 [Aphanomyces astaci]
MRRLRLVRRMMEARVEVDVVEGRVLPPGSPGRVLTWHPVVGGCGTRWLALVAVNARPHNVRAGIRGDLLFGALFLPPAVQATPPYDQEKQENDSTANAERDGRPIGFGNRLDHQLQVAVCHEVNVRRLGDVFLGVVGQHGGSSYECKLARV